MVNNLKGNTMNTGTISASSKILNQVLKVTGTGIGWEEQIAKQNPHIKKYEVCESDEDLLALSTCWKRLRDTNQPRNISSLTDASLFKLVEQEDRDKANVIRDYYSKKIMMLKLVSTELTPFRQDLNEFVHSDGKKFRETMLPIAYRLPEFYEYDTEFESFARECNREVTIVNPLIATKKLTFVKKMKVNTRRQRRFEYWLVDEKNNLVNLSFEIHNPLLSLLDNSLTNTVNLEGQYYRSVRDGQQFYKVDKYKFI